ncbi:juvenile hormone esterase-like isoform X2 [Anticarsia gemmatalis]|uniref:juvenile hormone esterase-like isoform X2 n=1 Tax=Anticarsia gemmatalis TaxID=129554 RepID=UPI003F772978
MWCNMKGTLMCVLVFITSVVCEVRVDPLVLVSSQGLVRGHKASDGDYSLFLGIPYAQIDPEDPFGPASDPAVFKEIIYNAIDGTVQCPQMTNEHESADNEALDCLRLNIYVPFKASVAKPLPVLVWFHGGGFARGSAGEYGVSNLVKHDVVVVTVNYRLGPYGFMCLDIPTVPGNQGLKDQYTALNWIKNHIGSFGGNPYNLTIAGQDAGATSVLLHLFSSNDRLFQKAIVESGTPQSEGMFVNSDVNAAIKIAGHLGFNTTDTQEAIKFLTTTPHDLVTAAAYELDLQLKPCKERSFSGIKNFVETDPFSLTNTRKVSRTSVLIGYTSLERDSLSSDYFDSDPFVTKLQNNFNLAGDELERAARMVRRFYIGDHAVSKDVINELEQFESDFGHNHPTERVITQLLEENANVIYEYLFNYVGDSGAKGAGHSAELNYLFNMQNVVPRRSEADQVIVDRITTLWTNFVNNPSPRGATDLIPVEWTPVTTEMRPSLVIDSDIRMEGRVYKERMAFWDLFYSMYGDLSKLSRDCSNSPYMCC